MRTKFTKSLFTIAIISLSLFFVGCPGKHIRIKPLAWDKCTLSSNWHGKNANWRMMNMLSPYMNDVTFNARLQFMKDRGCNTAHLFICNIADGECASPGYSIYGQGKPSFKIDQNFVNHFKSRIEKIQNAGIKGIVLWCAADDDKGYNKLLANNADQYFKDLKSTGLLDYASTVVIGLEVREYWSSAQCAAMVNACRKVYNGKIGVHDVSGRYDLAGHGDIVFYQVNPGTSDSKIASDIKKIKSTLGKPVNMFEMERQEDRHRSEVALKAGAFAVGNW